MDDLVELLDERLPGGASEDQSPDSAEEYEQQRDNEQQYDQAGVQEDSEPRNGTGPARTTPDWTPSAGPSHNQTQSN